MNLFNLRQIFGSEKSCKPHFNEERDIFGVQCKCENKVHFWIKADVVMNVKKVETKICCGA
jgi:hypothetical protein